MPPSDSYHATLIQSGAYNEANDCTVIATAVVTGLDYGSAHQLLASYGRRPRCGLPPGHYHAAIAALGFTVQRIHLDSLRTPGQGGFGPVSIERVLRRWCRGRKFFVSFRGHVAAFDGERLADWTRGRRHHVRHVYEVIPPLAPTVSEAPTRPTPTAAPAKSRQRGACASVWAVCDDLATWNHTVTSAMAIGACLDKGLNKATAARQFQHWRKARGH